MGSVNFVVIVESVQNLITAKGDLKEFHLPSILAVSAALGISLKIACPAFCCNSRRQP
jgi:hypothetical protein